MKRVNVPLMLVTLIASAAHAENNYCPSSPPTPFTQQLAQIAVSRALPVGSDIPGTQRVFTFNGNCKGRSGWADVTPGHPIIACYYGSGEEVAGFPGVYETGVEGIGIALQNSAGQRVSGIGSDCDTRAQALGYISRDASMTFGYTVTLTLVKTGDTATSGTLDVAQTKFGMGVYDTGLGIGSQGQQNYIGYAGDIVYKAVSCTVPSTLTVNMGAVPVGQFSGPGSTSGEQSLSIPVRCDDKVAVNTSISRQGYLSPTLGVVALSNETGVAQGVGVQVLYNGSPVQFDRFFPVGTIPEAGASITLPLTFRYYQNTPEIHPGHANAVATLTMMYN